MQENSYIQVLIQSLHQKVEALDSIIEKNKEQYEILSAEEADMDAFEKNIEEKSQYIDKIVFLDDGFEEIYTSQRRTGWKQRLHIRKRSRR